MRRISLRKGVRLSAVGALLALGLAELLARGLTGPPAYYPNMVFDPGLGFRPKPDLRLSCVDERGEYFWETNSLGFLGRLPPEDGRGRSSRAKRLLFLGDSFLHSWGIRPEEAMPDVAARRVSAAGTEAEAYNLSCSDYGTAQEILLLREYGPGVGPDAVVLQVYPSNDVPNNGLALAGETLSSRGDWLRPYLVPDASGELVTRYWHPLPSLFRRSSRLYALLEKRVLAYGKAEKIDWLQPGLTPETAVNGVGDRLARGLAPTEQLEFLWPHPPGDPWEEAWEQTEALISGSCREARRLEARCLVLVVPHRLQVQRDAFSVGLSLETRFRSGKALDELADWNGAERRLASYFAREGIEGLFLADSLRKVAAKSGRPVYQRDGHLNERGHAIAGGAVADWFLGHPLEPLDSPPSGVPAPLLPAAREARGRLDFRAPPETDRERFGEYLGPGWLGWNPSWFGADPGWMSGLAGNLVLRPGPGPLVLRATAPPQARFPLTVTLMIDGLAHSVLEVGGPGPFEVRLPHRIPPSYDGYVRVTVFSGAGPGPTEENPEPYGVVVHEIGFVEG